MFHGNFDARGTSRYSFPFNRARKTSRSPDSPERCDESSAIETWHRFPSSSPTPGARADGNHFAQKCLHRDVIRSIKGEPDYGELPGTGDDNYRKEIVIFRARCRRQLSVIIIGGATESLARSQPARSPSDVCEFRRGNANNSDPIVELITDHSRCDNRLGEHKIGLPAKSLSAGSWVPVRGNCAD